MWKAVTRRAGAWMGLVPLAAALAALMICSVPVRGADADPVASVLARAQAALTGGNAAAARQLADDALKTPGLEPLARARLLLDRGLAFALMGARDKALIDFTMAINAHALPAAEQAQALLQRGFLLDAQGRMAAALGDYTAAIRLVPGNARTALNNRANIYRRQGKLKLARQDYLAALKGGNPRPEYALTGLGQIAEAEGDTVAARRYYARAIAANAHYAPAINRLAALGGPLADNADTPQEPIHLRPPPGATPDAAAAGFTVARPPPKAPIRLHMPPPRAPIHLHMPETETSSMKAPPLRPALDGSQPPPVMADGALVQLGSWRSRTEAEAGWKMAGKRAKGLLDGLEHVIQTADLAGRGRYYRLRVMPGPDGARALCAALRAEAMDCLVIGN